MTESPDSPEHDAVRRLLADARHDGPTPPEVVVRLEDTLASLKAERSAERRADVPTGTPVIDLAARRRRRMGVGVLAAAAVVVAGVALGQGLPGMGGPGSNTESSASSQTAAESDAQAGSAAPAPSDFTESQAVPESGETGDEVPGEPAPSTLSARTPARLDTTDADLSDQLIALRSAPRGTAVTRGPASTRATCDLPGLGRGRRVYAEVDGVSGLVLFRSRDGSQQQAELYQCGTPTPVLTLTLPAR